MTEKEIYFNSFIYLLYKITPNLRYIFLDFDQTKNKTINIIAYYEQLPSEIEMELLDDLATDIVGMIDEPISYTLNSIVSTDHLNSLKSTQYLLFARFEGIGF